MGSIAAEAFGVGFVIRADDDLAGQVVAILPPGHVPLPDGSSGLPAFTVARGPGGAIRVDHEREQLVETGDPGIALAALDARLRTVIAAGSPGMVFVHAGVVARAGRAIVLPAASMAGKTELVAALLRAGATYFSDEFAVIDPVGRVHPYPRPLSIRERGTRRATRTPAAALSAPTGDRPAEVAVIAATHFSPDGAWRPARRSAADGALLLLAHAGQVRAHPERVLETVHRASRGAVVLEGPRGEADDAAPGLLELLG